MESNTTRSRLRELHGSGYEIADGQPNVIGWRIRDMDNHRVGVVDDLLFDEDQEKVRYIIANLKDNHFDLDKRKVLIPIGIAELHETDDDVIVPSVSAWQLRALPTYSGSITDYDEHEVYSVFSAPAATTPVPFRSTSWHKPQNFYEHSNFNQENMYRHRKLGEMRDKPSGSAFRKREGADLYSESGRSATGYTNERSPLYESDALAASHRSTGDIGRTNMTSANEEQNENLINKIKRVQAELNELERDLRENRR